MSSDLILAPALGVSSSTLWGTVADRVAETVTPRLFELPGHGTQAAESGITMAGLADAVVTFADRWGIDRFHYAGVSISGALGLQLARTYPQRLASVSVVCSAAKFGEPADWHERAEQVRAQGTSAQVESSAARWFAGGFLDRSPDVGGRLMNELAAADDESYASLCEVLADFDATGILDQITTPALVVSGTQDVVVPPFEGRYVADHVADGQFAQVDDAAHLVPVEQPQRMTDLLRDFCRGRA